MRRAKTVWAAGDQTASDPRPGFTLVEVLVVIAIIGVFLAAMFPALQASRELGRRATCTNNLTHLMIAIQRYESAYEMLPAGINNPDGPIQSEAAGMHHGLLVHLLPYLDEGNTYRQIDFSKSVYDPANAPVRELMPPAFICPSALDESQIASSYAGCHHDVEAPLAADNHGVFFLNSQTRYDDIGDGLSRTIFLGEKLRDPNDLGWMSGTRATLRNTGTPINFGVPVTPADGQKAARPDATTQARLYVGGFDSYHPSSSLFGFGDGSVRLLTDSIDPAVYQQLGHRSDGKLLDVRWFAE